MKYLFDLDGTVTNQEILPLIARDLGLENEMAELTRKTMQGEIPFEHSFRIRVEMLARVPINRVQEIVSRVSISKPILNFLTNHVETSAIVTGNLDIWIQPLREKIPVCFYTSKAKYEGNTLLGIKSILNKGLIGKQYDLEEVVVAVGDGNNDLEMLENAAIAIAYGGVHTPAEALLSIADYAIYQDEKLCQFLTQL